MKLPVIIALVFAATLASAEKQPFERYQSIIDRQMFGPLPPGFDPTKSPNDVQKSSSRNEEELTQDQAKLKSAIRFFVIDTKADGTVSVGFSDNSDPKAPKSYYLKVGETRDGWEVKKADPETATMTIAKGEVEVTLKLGGNSATDGNAAPGGGASAPAAASASGGASRRPGLHGGGLLGAGSLHSRRMQRQQEAEAKRLEAKAAEEAREAERQAKEDERQAQAEADKQQREAEREEQRKQLLAIQEELKRVREAKAAAAREESANEGEGNAGNDAE